MFDFEKARRKKSMIKTSMAGNLMFENLILDSEKHGKREARQEEKVQSGTKREGHEGLLHDKHLPPSGLVRSPVRDDCQREK